MNEEYFVCWHGAMWRDVPPPAHAEDVLTGYVTDAQRQLEYRARQTRLAAALPTEGWVTAAAFVDRAHVSEKVARNYLYRAAQRGEVETMLGARRPTGGRQVLYRRRQVQTEAA